MTEVKRIDIKEFRELGCLHELNRQFLHPLGLALGVVIDEETGEERLGGIWDSRDDPEGFRYGEALLNLEKAERFMEFRHRKIRQRLASLGYVIQPVNKAEGAVEGLAATHRATKKPEERTEVGFQLEPRGSHDADPFAEKKGE